MYIPSRHLYNFVLYIPHSCSCSCTHAYLSNALRERVDAFLPLWATPPYFLLGPSNSIPRPANPQSSPPPSTHNPAAQPETRRYLTWSFLHASQLSSLHWRAPSRSARVPPAPSTTSTTAVPKGFAPVALQEPFAVQQDGRLDGLWAADIQWPPPQFLHSILSCREFEGLLLLSSPFVQCWVPWSLGEQQQQTTTPRRTRLCTVTIGN